MGNCCATEAKPDLKSTEMRRSQGEKTAEELLAAAAALSAKKDAMKRLQEAVSALRTDLKSAQTSVNLLKSTILEVTEQAKGQYTACVRLLTRISILQLLSNNVKSEEFKSLRATQTLDDLVSSLLASSEVGRQTRSGIVSEIRAETLRARPGETDLEAIGELSAEKGKAEEQIQLLVQICAKRAELGGNLTTFTQKKTYLLKESSALSNDILFFKERKQEFLVKCSNQDIPPQQTPSFSPVSLIQSLFSLESDDFLLAGELSACSTELKYLEIALKSAFGMENQAEKVLNRISQLPVPKAVPRPAVSLLGVAAKVIPDDSDIDLMEEEMAEDRISSLREELKSLKTELKAVTASREEKRKQRLRLEEQLEANDFDKAELALKLIATRFIHRVKLERIWLFTAWRVAAGGEARPLARLIIG